MGVMEREKEVRDSLGKSNVEFLLDEVRNGRIEVEKIRVIALRMDAKVYGVYKEADRKNKSPEQMMMDMLDCWNNKGNDSPQRLQDILNDKSVALYALARKIETERPVKFEDTVQRISENQKIQETVKIIKIGLPEHHFELPLITSTPAAPSNQRGLVCASHAVGKAIVEILDSIGWNAEQKKIINDLIAKVQSNGQAENPDKFNGVKFKVFVTNQEESEKNAEITIAIRVQSRFGEKLERPHTYNTVPAPDVNLVEEKLRMVLRWDMWKNEDNDFVPHAIYAKEYKKDDKEYACINSWGEVEKYPTIDRKEIYAIDYISITQIGA